jgi:hypothetical protein
MRAGRFILLMTMFVSTGCDEQPSHGISAMVVDVAHAPRPAWGIDKVQVTATSSDRLITEKASPGAASFLKQGAAPLGIYALNISANERGSVSGKRNVVVAHVACCRPSANPDH